MLQHYIKTAYRNLLKYKVQGIISIVGLAIGLACFALSTFWVRYEMTYDDFHRDADHIYLVRMNGAHFGGNYSNFVPYALGNHLKTTYTEIEDFCATGQDNLFVRNGKRLVTYPVLKPDTTFIRMMDIKVLAGDSHFFRSASPEKGGIAITEKTARELFGTTDVIGKSVVDNNGRHEYRISALVSGWGEHTNFKYAFMAPIREDTSWDHIAYRMLIKIKPGTDIDKLLEKLNRNFPEELKKNKYGVTGHTRFILCAVIMQMQLHHLRHTDLGMDHRNRASLAIWMNVDMNVWAEKLKALPMVTEVVRPIYWPLVSMGAYSAFDIDAWDGLEGTTETPIGMDEIMAGEEFFKFSLMFCFSEGGHTDDLIASIAPGRQQEAIQYLETLFHEINGEGEFNYSFAEDEIAAMYHDDRRTTRIYVTFALIAIFISCLGLFGLSLYDIQQRYREIALRKVNGATARDVFRLLLRKYCYVFGTAFIVASGISYAGILKYMESYHHHAPLSLWMFLVAGCIVALISLGTLWWQIRKAIRINPAEVLKGE